MKRVNIIYLSMLAFLVMDYISKVDSQCNLPAIKSCTKGVKAGKSRFAVTRVRGNVVLCDTVTDGGGWVIFQRRLTKPNVITSFDQNWQKYKFGFGNLCYDNWWGLENLYNITNRPNQHYQLRIYVKTESKTYEAIYSDFRLDSEMNNYRLNLGEFTGNISNDFALHNGAEFATSDRDTEFQCACYYKVGWWFTECFKVNLNRKMGTLHGAHWEGLTNQNISLTHVDMSYRLMNN